MLREDVGDVAAGSSDKRRPMLATAVGLLIPWAVYFVVARPAAGGSPDAESRGGYILLLPAMIVAFVSAIWVAEGGPSLRRHLTVALLPAAAALASLVFYAPRLADVNSARERYRAYAANIPVDLGAPRVEHLDGRVFEVCAPHVRRGKEHSLCAVVDLDAPASQAVSESRWEDLTYEDGPPDDGYDIQPY